MDEDDDTGIDPEIAAAMGFATFGAQPSTKRRKFTHNDAIIEGQTPNSSARIEKVSGSGANNTALGVRSKTKPAAQEPTTAVDASARETSTTSNEKSKEKAKKGKQTTPRGLADYVAWGNNVAEKSETEATEGGRKGIPTRGQVETAAESGWPLGKPSEEELAALRRGVRNARGDMVYFLASFLEDPWERLRSEMGR